MLLVLLRRELLAEPKHDDKGCNDYISLKITENYPHDQDGPHPGLGKHHTGIGGVLAEQTCGIKYFVFGALALSWSGSRLFGVPDLAAVYDAPERGFVPKESLPTNAALFVFYGVRL